MRTRSEAIRPQDSENEINLTPMLDVVFIMLIFFLVTASFIRETGLDVNDSDSNHEPRLDSQSILVAISANNQIMIEGRHIDPRAVRANIERLRAEDLDAPLIIQPHRKSTNNTLVQVMNASREAGIYDFGLAAPDDMPGPPDTRP